MNTPGSQVRVHLYCIYIHIYVDMIYCIITPLPKGSKAEWVEAALGLCLIFFAGW